MVESEATVMEALDSGFDPSDHLSLPPSPPIYVIFLCVRRSIDDDDRSALSLRHRSWLSTLRWSCDCIESLSFPTQKCGLFGWARVYIWPGFESQSSGDKLGLTSTFVTLVHLAENRSGMQV